MIHTNSFSNIAEFVSKIILLILLNATVYGEVKVEQAYNKIDKIAQTHTFSTNAYVRLVILT